MANKKQPYNWGRIKPGDVISFSEDDASYWKKQAEKYYEQYKKPAESNGEMIEMTTDEIKETVTSSTDDVPF